jgi:hypothetical protein
MPCLRRGSRPFKTHRTKWITTGDYWVLWPNPKLLPKLYHSAWRALFGYWGWQANLGQDTKFLCGPSEKTELFFLLLLPILTAYTCRDVMS